MPKFTLPIKGMHCRSCEILLEEQLKEVSGVDDVKVSLKTKQAEVYSKHHIDKSLLENAVRTAGYEIGSDEVKPWLSRNPDDYTSLVIAFLSLLAIYFVAKGFGLGSINLSASGTSRSLPMVFIVGLTAGVSTCMALVGGLVLGIASRHSAKHPEATPFQNFRPHIYFNIGRILSYFILGGLIGWIGKAVQLSSVDRKSVV